MQTGVMSDSEPNPDAEQIPTEQIPQATEVAAPTKQRLRDRMFSIWSLLAVAVAGLIMGGLMGGVVGGGVGAVLVHEFQNGGHGGHHRGHIGPRGFDHDGRGPGGDWCGGYRPQGDPGWAPNGEGRDRFGQSDGTDQQPQEPVAPAPSQQANP